MAGELLGEAHRRLLDDLTTRLTALRQGDLTVPRVVLLTRTGRDREVADCS